MLPALIPGAEPVFKHGNTQLGCLFLHGFTASRSKITLPAIDTSGHAQTVYPPRLTHHGGKPAAMLRTHCHEWYLAALDAYLMLRSQCAQVACIGLSMGGATALLLATQTDACAAISLAAPLHLYGSARHAGWLAPFVRYIRKRSRYPNNPVVAQARYHVYPLAGVVQLGHYLAIVRANLGQLRAPTLLMHAADDSTVPSSTLSTLYALVGAPYKVQQLLSSGGHLLSVPQSPAYTQVLESISAFVAPFAGS